MQLNVLTSSLIIGTGFILSSASHAAPLMTKEQYADYSVEYRCIEQTYHQDLEKKEAELIKLESKYGLNDDNFDAFDELITEYERDKALVASIHERAKAECNK